MKSIKNNKRKQIRRCTACQKIGHNRSTCPSAGLFVAPAKSQTFTQSKPLNFYIHHSVAEPPISKHVIDLKKHNIWNEIEAISPEQNQPKLFHSYHQYLKPSLKKYAPINFKTIEPFKLASFKTDEIKVNSVRQPTKKIQKKYLTILSHWFSGQVKNMPKLPRFNFDSINQSFRCQADNFGRGLYQWQQIYFPFKRTVSSLVIFSLIIFAPTHAQSYYENIKLSASKVSDQGINGYDSLQDSTKFLLGGQIENAQNDLQKAIVNFNNAATEMQSNHKWLMEILTHIPILNEKIAQRQKLITIGQNISSGNEYLLSAITQIKQNSTADLSAQIDILNINLAKALPFYQSAVANLDKVDPQILPKNYQKEYTDFVSLFKAFVVDLQSINNSALALRSILGADGNKNYLIAFQNSSEIRPTGGFIGSFALITVANGKIIDLQVPAGGSYDLDGQLTEYIEPPTPMTLVNTRWYFHDANWFADYQASAQKMIWFYEHSRDNTKIDGVVAVNSEVLNRALDLFGPLEDKSRDLILTSANALTTIQKIVETGPEKQVNRPKQIITDLAPILLEKIKQSDPEQILPALYQLSDALWKKEIQLYFVDPSAQAQIDKFGWAGKILPTTAGQDYIFVVNTNLQGQKSDAVIDQSIDYEASIQPDGSIISTVSIVRKNNGESGDEIYGRTNVDYLRLYVPQGSQLISAGGFTLIDEKFFKAPNRLDKPDADLRKIEKTIGYDSLSGTKITDEFNKTSFGNWVVTQPQQTSRIYFTYRLPFKVKLQSEQAQKKWLDIFPSNLTVSQYQLIAQKQSGADSRFSAKLIYPDGWRPYWHDGEDVKLASNGASIEMENLASDQVWSLIMEKNI